MTLDPFHNFYASDSLCIKWDYNDVLVVSQLRVIVRRKFVQEKCSEEYLAFPPLPPRIFGTYCTPSAATSTPCDAACRWSSEGVGWGSSFPSDL